MSGRERRLTWRQGLVLYILDYTKYTVLVISSL